MFFYGHYFGYFAGSIYDELIRLPAPLWTLRGLTLALMAAGALWLHAGRLDGRPLPLRRFRRAPAAASLGLLVLVGAAHTQAAPLGLRASHAYIAEVLGGELQSQRCHLFLPRELADKARFGRDCDVRVAQMEDFFGLTHPERLRVYLFRNAGEKRALMGAGQTNIAKPWRHEIYLQQDAWPHPVMAHEIAHIVVGGTGIGPLRITGLAGGLWPNLGLVEGMAVAADFRSSSGLTPHQWARAMLELDRLPPLGEVFGAGFLGTHKRLAYVLAGSFIRHLHDTLGRDVLRRIYQVGSVAKAAGSPLAELERGWRDHLRTVPLPASARALAELRFSGGSILSAVCPHRVAELRLQLAGDLAAGDDRIAVDSCRAILALDPARASTHATLVGALSRLRDPTLDDELEALAGRQPRPEAALAAARHDVADELFRRGDVDGALAAYGALLEAPQNPDMRRLLQVKRLVLLGSAAGRQLMTEWLVAPRGQRAGAAAAVHLIRELRAERNDGLAHYLEARQLFNAGGHGRAAGLMAQALALGLATRELRREALRVEALCRTVVGEVAAARDLWLRFEEDASPAQRLLAEDYLQRIRIATRQQRAVSAKR